MIIPPESQVCDVCGSGYSTVKAFVTDVEPTWCLVCALTTSVESSDGIVEIEAWLGSTEALGFEAMAAADRTQAYEPFNWQINDNLFGEAA